MRISLTALLATTLLVIGPVGTVPVLAAEQDAIDGCIDRLREVGGPDARAGGEILSSEYSQAGTIVMLKDAGGSVWRCIGYDDGTVGELSATSAADDGGVAMAGADIVEVTGVASDDVLNVRSGPSTGHEIVGALANGDAARNLGCEQHGSSRWCHIQFLDEMAGDGWVNARYLNLSPAGATNGSAAGPGGSDRVRFAAGTSGAEIPGSLLPQRTHRYLLGASSGQDLYVRVAANGPGMVYSILNPDGSELLGEISADREYRGELWQSGDHTVVVTNRANGQQSYRVIFGIE